MQTFAGNPSSVRHVYQKAGKFEVQATALDEDGAFTRRLAVTVFAAQPPPSPAPPPNAVLSFLYEFFRRLLWG